MATITRTRFVTTVPHLSAFHRERGAAFVTKMAVAGRFRLALRPSCKIRVETDALERGMC